VEDFSHSLLDVTSFQMRCSEENGEFATFLLLFGPFQKIPEIGCSHFGHLPFLKSDLPA